MSDGQWVTHEVPPPKTVRVDPEAEALGLVPGLRVEKIYQGGQWRCAQCSKMQPGDAGAVSVPDTVRMGDPGWSVTESVRQNSFNGSGSYWCISCAKKLSRK